jgi:hypothetical protein
MEHGEGSETCETGGREKRGYLAGSGHIADLGLRIAECELGIMGFWLKADG